MSEFDLQEALISRFSTGYNCAETVISVLSEALDIECSCIPRIATGFGAGFGRKGEVCGAINGAVMAIGLVYGRDNSADKEAKEKVYALVSRLLDSFEKEFGSVLCRDITGCDLSTPEGFEYFRSHDYHNTLCPKFVIFAAEEALRLLEAQKNK